jgi:NAD+ synthase (glutamine-hydrolysing)
MNTERIYEPKESFLRLAAACPEVRLADVGENSERIKELYDSAEAQGASLVAFPELSLTGYTLGDLVQQSSLLHQAEDGLRELAEHTKGREAAMIVGFPLRVGNGLYNCSAVLSSGQIRGIVPKSNLPTYNEFYEDRWYQIWQGSNTFINIGGEDVPFGNDIIFDIAGVKFGIEICEDLWVANPPSSSLAEKGAEIIINPSASPEQIGKTEYRKDLVRMQSARLIAGYVYAGCDVSESTAEIVMGGHQLITENGHILNEKAPFSPGNLITADIDVDHIGFDRRRVHMATRMAELLVRAEVPRRQEDMLITPEKHPFFPSQESEERKNYRLSTAVQIQAHGLAMRMKSTSQERLVLGLSGGLDSTLALLVAYQASKILKKDPNDMIRTLTMPGLASSDQTQSNAQILAKALGVSNEVIPIEELSRAELKALGHDGVTQDITFENVQARARTTLLFNYANRHHGLVLGTGDLSEIALGWCTYNGDQQSHYNVNASIPKTLVKHLVGYLKEQSEYAAAKSVLEDILATPISPELTGDKSGQISQTTEDIIGPYELHEFFLYHLIRWGDKPNKIQYLANAAFEKVYTEEEINKWFGVFIKRFTISQFKRENMPNGPKVGSVSLSPRGDWRMPPDLYNAAVWSN